MSQTHLRDLQPPAKPINWWLLLIVAAALFVGYAVLVSVVSWHRSFPAKYDTATAKVLQIREVVDNIHDTFYGGRSDIELRRT